MGRERTKGEWERCYQHRWSWEHKRPYKGSPRTWSLNRIGDKREEGPAGWGSSIKILTRLEEGIGTCRSRLSPIETDTGVDGFQRPAFAYLTTNRVTSLRTATPYRTR